MGKLATGRGRAHLIRPGFPAPLADWTRQRLPQRRP
jgi:hypothetical protein